MAFSGSDSGNTAIFVAPSGLLTATPFATMVWMRPTVDNSATPNAISSSSGDAQRAWRIRLSDLPLEPRAEISFNGVDFVGASTSTVLTLNIWVHVGMDFDGTTVRLFINGVLDASSAQSGTVFASTRLMGIGAYDNGGGASSSQMDGDIEDMRYYNRILTLAEWATIHATKGLDGIVHGLVTRWPINELPPGTTIISSGPKDIGPAQLAVSSIDNSPTYVQGELRSSRRRAA